MSEESAERKVQLPEEVHSVPEKEAVGYMHIGVDPALDPSPDGYWIPVGEEQLSEREHPPRGAVIQYPKDEKIPTRVGDKNVPVGVSNWDYRGDGDDE